MLAALLSITVLTVCFTLISFIGEQKKPQIDNSSNDKKQENEMGKSKSPRKVMNMQPLPAISQNSISLTTNSLVPVDVRERKKDERKEKGMKR